MRMRIRVTRKAMGSPSRVSDSAASVEAAIQQYKVCAERYPESEFAGASLAKLVDYHVETKDYTQASDLLEQVFQDYPDAPFLDSMLLKWVLVAYRMGDFEKGSQDIQDSLNLLKKAIQGLQ